jgi:hypothetical protein
MYWFILANIHQTMSHKKRIHAFLTNLYAIFANEYNGLKTGYFLLLTLLNKVLQQAQMQNLTFVKFQSIWTIFRFHCDICNS